MLRGAVDTLIQDLRYAARSLAKSPVLSLAAVLTLALGIGANTAMFSVVDRLFFLAPTRVVDPNRVVRLFVRQQGLFSGPGGAVVGAWDGPIASYPRYADIRDHATSFSAVAAVSRSRFSLGLGRAAQPVQGAMVTASYFRLLGVRPALGRFFTDEEDRIGAAAHVAVLSHRFWRTHFNADSSVLGRPLQLGRAVYEVVGIAPRGFSGVDLDTPDLWLPMSAAAPEVLWPGAFECDGCGWLETIARLGPAVTRVQAATEVTAIFRGTPRQDGADSTAVASVRPLLDPLGPTADSAGRLSLWLGAVCGIVLLIACANVANLLLARALQRRRETAVRQALGASRARLVGASLAECGILTLLGGVTAVLLALWVAPLLQAALLTEGATPVALDLRAMAFTSGLMLLTLVVAGLAPALQGSRRRGADLAGALKAGARDGGVQRSRIRSALLVGQVALTLTLLTAAGLFFSSLRHVEGRRVGFDTDRLIGVSVDLQSVGYHGADADAVYERMRARVSRLPGVVRVSLTAGSPFGTGFGPSLALSGRDSLPRTGIRFLQAVTPGYFRTVGSRILRGRSLSEADAAAAGHVAVVNEAMARDLWPGQDPLGACLLIRRTKPCFTVVGVVETSRRGSLIEQPVMQYYIPLAQAGSVLDEAVTAMLVRTVGPAVDMAGLVRREVQATAPDVPFAKIDPFPSLLARQLHPWRMGSILLGLTGGLGLLLAAIGLYGVLSYVVSQRTREIGIRVALGATRRTLLDLVVRQGLRITLFGILLGTAGALLGGRAIASLLYEVSPHDPLVLSVVALVLVGVTVLASYVPARRATKVDPMVALRYE